jgi:hypothetical protein
MELHFTRVREVVRGAVVQAPANSKAQAVVVDVYCRVQAGLAQQAVVVQVVRAAAQMLLVVMVHHLTVALVAAAVGAHQEALQREARHMDTAAALVVKQLP